MTQRAIDLIVTELQKMKVSAKAESDTRGYVEVPKDRIVEVAKKLKELGFDHVKAVTGIDFPEQEKIQLIYHVSSYSENLYNIIFEIKSFTSYKDCVMPSLITVWESSWTGERETHEMLGVYFEGHPDMRRLFLPEDFDGVYPLRKEFKIKLEGLFVDKSE
ncbi:MULTISPECIES: NADH-quinone oxidoreductase subunit C [Acidianus]|uniref:NADH dehydrogenase n=1 Tax=Candidatus Acidianus copahuensis TaxID=1160895 RepID=A0A031LMV6_9CREN|nr:MULTISPECIES: NADH-quinone oxidoreductase subunit C [Acidianus]EZQ06978.1 NADH dehydrogenase [Candidatus Acidianus copahuensis]NON61993.1 NADH-quinone oxidoreductase subunit C [Acidianus sp. RZ1]